MFKNKKDFENVFLNMMKPLKKHIKNSGLEIGEIAAVYPNRTAQAEGLLRLLWGLVPYVCGSGCECDEYIKLFNQAFERGTDKGCEEYWGDLDDYNQLFVEMTAIAYAMLFAPKVFWEPLCDDAKARFATWLYEINNYKLPQNNWQMFRVLVNIALKRTGYKYSEAAIEESLEIVERAYLGEGWYTDGFTHRRDYYISFAIHFYNLLYARIMEKEDSCRAGKFKERAGRFAEDFIYWFSKNGEAVPYGRSLVYRFAQVAFWSACIIAGVDVFDYGIIKGIISRNLEYWLDKPIFDNSGILNVGYAYQNMFMKEDYNSSGSPYWCFKAFALLMLDDSHPFWDSEIKPLPNLDDLRVLKKANMIISRAKDNVCIYPTGFRDSEDFGNMDSKYSKFAYSSKFGFSVSSGSRNLSQAAADSMLAFAVNGYIYVSGYMGKSEIEDGFVYSEWSPISGISVKTHIIPNKNGHIRKHIINSNYECEAYDCGFSIVDDGVECIEETGMAEAKCTRAYCRVVGEKGKGVVIKASPNTNLLYSKTVIPSIKYGIKKGVNVIETSVNCG